jgi:hypothetical protein
VVMSAFQWRDVRSGEADQRPIWPASRFSHFLVIEIGTKQATPSTAICDPVC